MTSPVLDAALIESAEFSKAIHTWLRLHAYQVSTGSLSEMATEIVGAFHRLLVINPYLANAARERRPWVERVLGSNNQVVVWNQTGFVPEMPAGPELVLTDPSLVSPSGAVLDALSNPDSATMYDRLAALLRGMDDQWPAVQFRFLGTTLEGRFVPYLFNVQGLLGATDSREEALLTDPIEVWNVVLPTDACASLFERWANDEPYTGMAVSIAPPAIGHFSLERGELPPYALDRLIHPLPRSEASVRGFSVWGNGDTDHNVERLIQDASRESHLPARDFTAQYLGISWQSQGSFAAMVFPLSVSVSAAYDGGAASAQVAVRYRRPYTASSFWLRVGPAFLATDPTERFGPEQAEGDGWWSTSTTVEFSHDAGFAFVGTSARPNRAEWQLKSPFGRSISQRQGREALLHAWYSLAGQTLDNDMRTANKVFGEGRRNPTANRLELAVANLCAACGLPVYLGGKILVTPGVDLMALDAEAGCVYVVSVTASNAAREKYAAVKAVLPSLAREAGPQWTLVPVVVSAQPSSAFIRSDLADIVEDGGTMITWDTIEAVLNGSMDSLLSVLRPRRPPNDGRYF